MTTSQIQLPSGRYVLTECDDFFKLEKGNIIELDKKNELKELFKYPFRHLDLIERIESSDKFIFVKSEMINNNKYMLTIFEKNKEKIYSVSLNFYRIKFEKDYILLYGVNIVDNKTICKNTCEISNGIVETEDKYQNILESKEYIDADNSDFSVTGCSHDENVFILCTDNYDTSHIIYMNDLEINSFAVMPYFVEREEGIFYQNEEFEWYYNDILLKEIKGNNLQFGNEYIVDYVDDKWFLYKINPWDKCDRCNVKIPEYNKCDFCKIKFCNDCKGDDISFYHCKTCNQNWCILSRDTYCEKNEDNRYNNSSCENCGN